MTFSPLDKVNVRPEIEISGGPERGEREREIDRERERENQSHIVRDDNIITYVHF